MTVVLDTHALVWWAASPKQLSARAARAVRSAVGRGELVASAISIFEIATAVRRGRLEFSMEVDQWLDALKALPELRIEPITEPIARMAGSFGEGAPGDPADRIIAATAMVLPARLVSADSQLRKWKALSTVW